MHIFAAVKRLFLFVLTYIFCLFASAQQPQPTGDQLKLVSSSSMRLVKNPDRTIYYRPVFEHKGSTLSADSGYMYEDAIGRQFFEAFDNVVITQPSGTIIYSDKLHYDAAPQVATLTRNVRMVDRSSVLTTNYLTYNMRSKVGTYTGGGRIVSKGDTITSKNAYYFENTQDAYFRNKVVVRTPDVRIYTDTMRYNSVQRVTYFFGPTNIKGNKGENLYTEKGNYNTAIGVARFSKNNLYTEGSKFLKGDSLYYDRATGEGKAYRNVVFVDTVDKFYANGGYGLYKQSDESITMTDKPLVTMVIKKDSTSTSDSTSARPVEKEEKSKKSGKEKTVEKKKSKEEESFKEISPITPVSKDSVSATVKPEPQVDSAYMTADTLYSKVIFLKDYKALDFKLDRNGGLIEEIADEDYGDDDGNENTDSLSMSGNISDLSDSTQTDSVHIEGLKSDSAKTVIKQVKETSKTITKTSTAPPKKPAVVQEKGDPNKILIGKTLAADSVLRHRTVLPKGNESDSLINKALLVAKSPDSVTTTPKDSAYLDTARTRIIIAHYNVRMFKSDLQAVADSVYYGMADSMFRFMGRPMIWAEGSQISADTLYLQIKKQRLDNMLLVNSAFMVNAVLDTIKFNQLKGRKITGFFEGNNLDRLFVDGNAENMIFVVNEEKKVITEMFHDRSSRIKILMENRKIKDYVSIRKVDGKVYPLSMVTNENEVLPGFIWRPEDRPVSKEDLLNRKREIPKDINTPATGSSAGSKSASKDPVAEKKDPKEGIKTEVKKPADQKTEQKKVNQESKNPVKEESEPVTETN